MNITICGSGNLSHALVSCISKENVNINILSYNKNKFKEIFAYDINNKFLFSGYVNEFTDDPSLVIPNSDIIIFTTPSFIREKYIKNISNFISNNTIIGSFPGTSGFDEIINKYVTTNVTIFSSQRIPCITRIKEYGHSVIVTKKLSLNIYVSNNKKYVINVLKTILNIDNISILNSFLEVNLSNSNPLLHTSRLHVLFKNYDENVFYENEQFFYRTWNNETSNILLKMDNEFMILVNELKLSNIKSIKEHYEVNNEIELTNKIKNILAFKNIKTPMIKTIKGYIPNFNSRYFLEDFNDGLVYIYNMAKKNKISTPTIFNIINWYKKIKK